MEVLKEFISRSARVVGDDIVQVDMFLNHQLDVALLDACGKAFYDHFKDKEINKILTIEASGIAIAVLAARHFNNVPVVFCKKKAGRNSSDDKYSTPVYSYTKNVTNDISVSKDYLGSGDKVLVIDDFLAEGNAVHGMVRLCNQAGAQVMGVGIVVEKAFQQGGSDLRSEGHDVMSLARIGSIVDGKVTFED